jgi:serine/threonine protein kinase
MPDLFTTHGNQPIDGKYKILERLGSGGMGDVYKVQHVYLGTIRVIKAIRAQISDSADANERFLREAQLATRVQHPNVAMIHDFAALPDGTHYMVWEYIEGENLAQRIKSRGTLPPRDAVRLTIQILNGLEAIHRAGVIHRDISPENIMITPDGNVKIIDLGVAKFEESDVSMTRTGIFVGKLRYASPEQLGFMREGEKIDARTDLYSVGMVLYEMLTGRPPFEGKSPHDYIRLHSEETSLQLVDVSRSLNSDPALQAILLRALARDRNKRFQNAAEFRAALEELELRRTTLREAAPTLITELHAQSPSRAKWLVPAIIGVFVVAVIAFAVFAFRGREEKRQQSVAAVVTQPNPTPAKTQVDVNVAPTPSTVQATTAEPVVTETHAVAPPSRPRPSPPAPLPADAGRGEALSATTAPQLSQTPLPAARGEGGQRPGEGSSPLPAAYREGGDGDVNGPLLDKLKSQVHGIKTVAVDAGAMQSDLVKALQHEGLTVADHADVAIKFDGVLEHLGLGRKKRGAHASILKNGRVVFRYEMPEETYRVGDTPVEAFVSAVSGAFKD